MKKFWTNLSVWALFFALTGSSYACGGSDGGPDDDGTNTENSNSNGSGSSDNSGSGGGGTTDALTLLKNNVTDHTTTILTALKQNGITPKWVQVGNETYNGMLWDTGRLWNDSGDLADGWSNYVALSNAGYDAVKAVFSDAQVIIHINNAFDDRSWWFTKFKQKGGKMDMIGLSHYPQSESGKTWSEMNNLAINHISQYYKSYNVPVMVCEVGVQSSDIATGKTIMEDFVTRAQATTGCSGIFYWEPEVYGGWRPNYYKSISWNSYDKGAFTSEGKPSSILDVFGSTASSYVKGADISWVTEMEDGGISFYNSNGVKTDCFRLMKDCGMNAVRLRVWVYPEKLYGSYCNQSDVVAKALRAKALGMDIMIDFHYSDFFADPSRQTKPSGW